jgi:hypothetical protein
MVSNGDVSAASGLREAQAQRCDAAMRQLLQGIGARAAAAASAWLPCPRRRRCRAAATPRATGCRGSWLGHHWCRRCQHQRHMVWDGSARDWQGIATEAGGGEGKERPVLGWVSKAIGTALAA